jgi:hypothetical protein
MRATTGAGLVFAGGVVGAKKKGDGGVPDLRQGGAPARRKRVRAVLRCPL